MANDPALTLPDELLAKLRARYAEPHRHYHALGHVEALLRWLDSYRALAAKPALIEAAIWFHDAVYDTRRHDNEARSAHWARDELTALAGPTRQCSAWCRW
jgi:predicted metal-dependent HD superfamily phosphohydrolase